MCDDCTEMREKIKSDLAGLLADDSDNDLFQAVERNLPSAVKTTLERIDKVISSGQIPEERRPSNDEVEEAVRDCLVAAVLATGAAAIARSTPGYTDEGKMPSSMILGQWAGVILENEMKAAENDLMRYLLGMGDN